MARFLIVGVGEQLSALQATLERDGNVARVLGPDRPLHELVGALDHVAIVCWLSAEVSPERFLLSAIDSCVRGVLYESAGGAAEVSRIASRNSIPLVIVGADRRDAQTWEGEVLAAIRELLEKSRR